MIHNYYLLKRASLLFNLNNVCFTKSFLCYIEKVKLKIQTQLIKILSKNRIPFSIYRILFMFWNFINFGVLGTKLMTNNTRLLFRKCKQKIDWSYSWLGETKTNWRLGVTEVRVKRWHDFLFGLAIRKFW